MDYSRHRELFNPYDFNDTHVHVVGVGATGSWLVLSLAKLGITNIHVYDFDVVSEHNLPNQFFSKSQIGMKKVDALYELVKEFADVDIKTYDEEVKENDLKGYVFNMVDTMTARRTIWENCIRYKPRVKLFIEPRLGMDGSQIYMVNPMKMSDVKTYEKSMNYSDDDAEVSACGHSLSVISSSMAVVSTCVRSMIEHWNEAKDLPNLIISDYKYNNLLSQEWKM